MHEQDLSSFETLSDNSSLQLLFEGNINRRLPSDFIRVRVLIPSVRYQKVS